MTDRADEFRAAPTEISESPQICQHCGAQQLGPGESCWLCHQALSTPRRAQPTEAVLSEPAPDRFSFSLSTLFLIVTLASVCLGLIVALPGLGVVACLIMGPVLIRTLKVVRHRDAAGKSVGPGEKVTLFVGSFAVVSVIAVVACLAAFGTFCSVCLSVNAMQGGGSDLIGLTFLVIVLTLLSIWWLVRSIQRSRQRYRRAIDIEERPK